MNVLSIENLSKTVNDEPLFENVSLGLESGEKVGVVGHNGAGKSTFLKLLSLKLYPDEGKISLGSEEDVVTLLQEVNFKEGATLASFLYEGDGKKIKLLNEYNKALEAGLSAASLDPIAEKEEIFSLETNYKAALTDLDLRLPMDTPFASLSGGEQKKAALARLIASRGTILLLDEPTNHLDIKSIEYLEKFISSSSSAIITVTHDRYLLENTSDTIWEIDGGKFYRHPGSYDVYLERKSERLENQKRAQKRLYSLLRRELGWLSRAPKARGGKDKSRKERIEAMMEKTKGEDEYAPSQFSSLARRLGKTIVNLNDISFSYGDRVLFEGFTYLFKKDDKIGIVANNGEGKSTLLDIITGFIKPSSGNLEKGVNTIFGYYDQKNRNLPEEKTALEYIEEIGSRIFTSGGEVSSEVFLQQFGFSRERIRTKISTFSGGEKRRLYLISKLALNPNFLILDEPTNDLDIATMESLEEYIDAFPGVVLIVSHDRAFLDCTCSSLFVFEHGRIKHFEGKYSDLASERASVKKEKAAPKEKNKRQSKGLSYAERKEYEALELKIDESEKLIARIEESFASFDETEDGTLSERGKKYALLKETLEAMVDRYLELEEKDEA